MACIDVTNSQPANSELPTDSANILSHSRKATIHAINGLNPIFKNEQDGQDPRFAVARWAGYPANPASCDHTYHIYPQANKLRSKAVIISKEQNKQGDTFIWSYIVQASAGTRG